MCQRMPRQVVPLRAKYYDFNPDASRGTIRVGRRRVTAKATHAYVRYACRRASSCRASQRVAGNSSAALAEYSLLNTAETNFGTNFARVCVVDW